MRQLYTLPIQLKQERKKSDSGTIHRRCRLAFLHKWLSNTASDFELIVESFVEISVDNSGFSPHFIVSNSRSPLVALYTGTFRVGAML